MPRTAARPRRLLLPLVVVLLTLGASGPAPLSAPSRPAVTDTTATTATDVPATDAAAGPPAAWPGTRPVPAAATSTATRTAPAPDADARATGDPTTAAPAGPPATPPPASPAPSPAASGAPVPAAGGAAPPAPGAGTSRAPDPVGSVEPVVPTGTAAAVHCPALATAFSTVSADGTVPAGAATMTWAADPAAAGRTLTWALTAPDRTLAGGSVQLGAAGSAGVPVTLPAGRWSATGRLGWSDGSTTGTCPASSTAVTVVPRTTWASGASGAGVGDGTFGTWRGSPATVAGTWADNPDASLGLWQLRSGGEYARWTGDLDIAVGAIGSGETWAAAARGAYDARWRQSLQTMAQLWAGRPGQLHIRFAHEFNGDWYPWSVTAATVADFRTAWQRYRALQQQVFPGAALVFSPNSDTASSAGLDWRTAFPGAQHVDVVAVDHYNQYPWTGTAADFTALSLAYDRFGAPRGLQRHAEFAASVGLPFAVAEWGANADAGDSAVFVEQMQAFFAAHAGDGPGRLRYEVFFNVVWDGNPWALYPSTRSPRAAEAYRRLF